MWGTSKNGRNSFVVLRAVTSDGRARPQDDPMTRRRDQAGDARIEVPWEYADLAARVARHLSAEPFDPAVRARHLHQLRELAALQSPARSSVRREHGSIASRWRGFQRRV